MQPGETIKPGGATVVAPPQLPAQPKEPVAAQARPSDDSMISWSASEYIAHQKNLSWYATLGVGAAVLASLTYLLTSDAISTAVIIIVSVMFGFAAARQPRTLDYTLDDGGVTIGEKFYPYADFKSFSIMEEEAIDSIMLMPMRRFMPGVSMYYPPGQEEQIITALSAYLPHEERSVDMVDRLARKLRF